MIPTPRQQVGYASGNFGKSLMWTSLEYFLLFYLTEFAGVAPELAGAIILVSLFWDGAINPLLGYWLDRRAASGRDYRPFLRWAPPVAGFCFVLIFAIPAGGTALLFAILMAFRTAYALLDVPHNALLAHMPLGAVMRTRLASMRFFFSSLGGLLVATIAAPVLISPGTEPILPELRILAICAAVLLCLTLWQSLGPARLALARRYSEPVRLQPRRYLKRLLGNPAAITYLAMAAIFAASAPLFPKSLPFLLTYVRQDPSLLPTLLAAMTIGQMIAMPVLTWFFGRVGRGRGFLTSLTGLALSCGLVGLAIGAGAAWLCAAAFCFGFFLGGSIIAIWAMVGDVADHLAEASDVRADGGLVAFLTFIQKAGIGFGALLAGAILRLGGFEAGQAQGEGAQAAIIVASLCVPAIGAAVTAIIFLRLKRRLP